MWLQFEPLVCVGVMYGLPVDRFLHQAHFVDAAYVGCPSVEVVFCPEEDIVRCEGEEDRRYFTEAVSDGEDVDHILSCS